MNRTLNLVTGATGFIGSEIMRLLETRQKDVVAVERLGHGKGLNLGPRCTLDALFGARRQGYSSIAVIHLACETSAFRWEREGPSLLRSHRQTLTDLIRLVSEVREQGIDVRFVSASTATVIGSFSGVVTHGTEGIPETFYDAWKMEQESRLSLAARSFGFSLISLRLPNIYGRRQNRPAEGRGFITLQIEKALRGEPLHIVRRIPFIRDYLHVEDTARAFIKATEVEKQINDRYFIGTGVGSSMGKMLTLIADSVQTFTHRRPVVIDVSPPGNLTPLDCRSVVMDYSEFKKLTGWVPLQIVEQGIHEMVKSMADHRFSESVQFDET